ncbi:MAG: TPM domain-containing protein [Lachnospiraceae bacterium]|nr:TPM domain-containing protein [Lachnospiraceae bacterium]
MMKKRSILAGLLAMLLVLGMCVPVLAASDSGSGTYESIAPSVADTTNNVYDFAGLLSDSERADLEKQIADCAEEKNYRVLVVATDDNPGTAMAYADDFFDFNEFGPDGVVFLLDMDNREQWISTTGVCTADSSDKKASYDSGDIDDILDETTSYASDGDYAKCFSAFVKEVNKKGNILYLLLPTFWSLVISLVLAAVAFAAMVGKHQMAEPINNAKIEVKTSNMKVGSNSVVFLGNHTTSRRIPRNTGGGGGGGGMHMGGSGTSHGGGGRGF